LAVQGARAVFAFSALTLLVGHQEGHPFSRGSRVGIRVRVRKPTFLWLNS